MKDTSIKDRDQFVAKSNELITRSIYSFNAEELQIVDYATSKIGPNDTADTWYNFTVTDYCRANGITMDGGRVYNMLKDTMKRLRDKSWYIKTDKGKYTTISWFNKVTVNEDSGLIEYRFDEDVHPYLFYLTKNYSTYRVGEVLCFKSKYSIALYQELLSCIYKYGLNEKIEKVVMITVEQLKEKLDAKNYGRYQDFKRRVLQTAIEEINLYSEQMKVAYEETKIGRKVTAISFLIWQPKKDDQYMRRMARNRRLNGSLKERKSEK